MKKTTYEDIRGQLDTGDIVFFSGRGLGSLGIMFGQYLNHSRRAAVYTHVGLVYKPVGSDDVFLWESTTLTNLVDIDTGLPAKGVQLVQLSKRIDTYSGDVAVRRLIHPRPNSFRVAFASLRKSLVGKPYEKSQLDLILSALQGEVGYEQKSDLSTVFCSEMVAYAYKHLGLIDEESRADKFCPADFVTYPSSSLVQGALEPMVEIKRAKSPAIKSKRPVKNMRRRLKK